MSNNKSVCKSKMCAGCMACIDACPVNAIQLNDKLSFYDSVIDIDKCINCGICTKVCPNMHEVEKKEPISWYQGWANDIQIRIKGSSGGVATAIACGFLEQGGVCCLCSIEQETIGFHIIDDNANIKFASGSKYVKSSPKGIYKKIRKLISEGKKVLFVGLPCQCAALHNYIGKSELLYMVDLICHGTPSPKLLEKFLNEQSYKPEEIKELKFREKLDFGIYVNKNRVVPKSVRDKYTHLFLNSVDYTENCYSCKYADIRRVSDVTLGDAWSSELHEETSRGVSFVMCQTEKGEYLLECANLHLEEIDLQREIEMNHQLSYPSRMHPKRKQFFRELEKTGNFSKSANKVFRKIFVRQKIKMILIKSGLF